MFLLSQAYMIHWKNALLNCCDINSDHLLEETDALLESTPEIKTENGETTEPFKLELKPLPDTLKYRFLGLAESLLVIIASNLYDTQE